MQQRWLVVADVHRIDWALLVTPVLGAIFVCFAIFTIRHEKPRGTPGAPSSGRRLINRYALVFSLVWTAGAVYANWDRAIRVPGWLDGGQVDVSTGPITRLVVQPWKGHGTALFTVRYTRFHYFDYDVKSSEDRILSPGCLAEGRTARVTHRGERILKLEVLVDANEPLLPCEQTGADGARTPKSIR